MGDETEGQILAWTIDYTASWAADGSLVISWDAADGACIYRVMIFDKLTYRDYVDIRTPETLFIWTAESQGQSVPPVVTVAVEAIPIDQERPCWTIKAEDLRSINPGPHTITTGVIYGPAYIEPAASLADAVDALRAASDIEARIAAALEAEIGDREAAQRLAVVVRRALEREA